MSHIQVGGRKGRVVLLLVAVAAAAHFWPDATLPPSPDGVHQQRHLIGVHTEYALAHAGTRAAAVPNSGETSSNKDLQGSVAHAKLHLPPGACRLQSDAEGNVVGTCAVPAGEPVGTRLNPFGGISWNTPSPLPVQ
ncbi:hypothetical protein RQP54_00715 [Curvibacter sp. APW13]|uniref:hypothetical protein n=1 Tax=Curvibacter sp. APW13 TaxID=3077236 RepID=UPI0028DE24D1|nr:hypothetical protein [Curvibacter sp. APW13]MDT8989377.1 hypothetical protein [Curvibacter sp. APW13]